MANLNIGSHTIVSDDSGTPSLKSIDVSSSVTFPAGHVIQVVQTVKTDYFNSQSTTFQDITGLSVSITPKYTSSKILVMWSIAVSGSGHYDIRLARVLEGTETSPYIGDAMGSRIRSTHHHYMTTSYNTTWNSESDNGQYLDNPNTTSEITYKFQCANPHSSSYYVRIGYQYSDADNNYSGTNPSSMTLLEIAG